LRRKFGMVTLVLLSFTPTVVALVLQFLGTGYGITIASQVAVSDSSGWQSCASSFAAGHASIQMDWCLRRPLAVPVLGTVHALAPFSASSVLMIQVVLLGFSSFWLAVASVRVLRLNFIFAAVGIVFLWWPSLTYGLSHGPEATALSLSIISLTTLLAFLSSRHLAWALASGLSMLAALSIRPGNLLLTGVLLVVLLLFLQRYTQKAWLTAIFAATFIIFWFAPNRIFQLFGFSEAGHGANFWFTMYSAATPEADDYNIVYEVFAVEAQRFGTESRAFGETVRAASLDLIQTDPLPLLQQVGANLNALWERDLLTRSLAVPGNSNLGFLNPVAFLQDPTISRSIEAASGFLWLSSAVLVVTAIASLLIIGIELRTSSGTESTYRSFLNCRMTAISLAVAAFVGSVSFYALVGHDEGERHLVQTAPFLVLGLLTSVDTVLQYISRPKQPLHLDTRAVTQPVKSITTMFIVLVLVLAFEGRQSASSILVRESCQETNWEVQLATPIAIASNGSRVPLQTATSWREADTNRFQTLARQSNWIAPLADDLPPGFFMTLRFSDGDTELAYIDTSRVADGTLAAVAEVCFEPVSPASPLIDIGLGRVGYPVVGE